MNIFPAANAPLASHGQSFARASTSASRGGRPSPRNARLLVPRAVVRARQLQRLRGGRHSPRKCVPSSHGQPFARNHFSTSRWPPNAAFAHVNESHRQSFARTHLSTSRWPPLAAAQHVSSSPEQSFSRAHFSTSRWPPPAARAHVFSSHGQSFARAHFSTSRRPRKRPSAHVHLSHGQSFSRAHLSTSRWPPFAARARPTRPRAAVLARPLQHLEVATLRRPRARPLVPRAVVLARPLQHLEVAAPRRVRTCVRVPRAVVLARPLEHLEVAAPRRVRASFRSGPVVPRAHFSVSRWPPMPRTRPDPTSPREILAAQRLQRLEISIARRCGAHRRRSSDRRPRRRSASRCSVSALSGIIFLEHHLPPGRFHRVAHAFAHRAKHREVRGVGQVVFNERDGDIEGKAREGDARLRVEVPRSLARARLDAASSSRPSWLVRTCVVARAPRASLVRLEPRPRSEI